MSVTQTTGIFDKINSVATTIAYGNSVAPSYTTVGLPNFSSNAMTTANLTIASGSYFKNLSFPGFTSGNIVAPISINILGNLTIGNSTSPAQYVNFNFLGQGLYGEPYGVIKATWNLPLTRFGNLYMNASGNGAITLANANTLIMGNVILQNGYFDTANHNITMTSFNANYAVYPGERSLNIGNSTITIGPPATSGWVIFDTGGGSNAFPGQTCGVFSSNSGNTRNGGVIQIRTESTNQSVRLGTNTNGIASNSLPKIYWAQASGSFPLTFYPDGGQLETFNNGLVTEPVIGNISVYHDVVLNNLGISTQYSNLSMSIRGRQNRTCNVTPSNKALGNISIDGTTLPGGNTVILANLSCNNFTLNSGNLTIGNVIANSYTSNTSDLRRLTFGNVNGQIAVTTNNTTVFNQNGANLTLAGNTYYVRLGYASTVGTRTVILSGYSDSNVAPAITTSGTSGIVLNTTATDILAVQGTAGDITLTSYGGTLDPGTGLAMYGNLTLGNTTNTSNVANVLTFAGAGTETITTNGRTVNFPLTFDGAGGTWTFQDALTMLGTRTLTLANGTVKLKSSATSTVGDFVTTGSTLKYLQSSTNGTQATISKASGTVTVTYLSIKDSNAAGSAVWLASDATNVDAGNNTGWYFSPPPTPTSTGNMFIIFN
jgi:hypothetical protein